jgi:hypothetical protein
MKTSRATPNREEALQPLLLAILSRLRRFRDTPLRFGINNQEIAAAAWNEFIIGLPEKERSEWQDQNHIGFLLTTKVLHLLSPESPPDSKNTNQSLADWISQLYCVLRETDDRAVEIMELRVDGLQARDIAEQLNLGLRLVKRILHQMDFNWNHATTPA